jgi:hypothetical protein
MGIKVAHIREQGVNMIIVPLDDSFGYKAQTDQDSTISAIQFRARSAGLAGTVVPVWNDHGRMAFRAPTPWHSYFRSLNMSFVWANVNKVIN